MEEYSEMKPGDTPADTNWNSANYMSKWLIEFNWIIIEYTVYCITLKKIKIENIETNSIVQDEIWKKEKSIETEIENI